MPKIKRQNYTPPPDAVKPSDEELQALRTATKQRIRDIVNNSGKRAMPYYDVIKQLEREGYTSPWVDNWRLVEAVHKQWHPEDFQEVAP